MNATEPAQVTASMTRDEMYERVIAHDAACNGRFFFGVRTTGVYCLPSCRSKRPLRTNVLFFVDTSAARSAGLRPCRRCHPDDFARGFDPVIEEIDALAAEVRDDPSAFPSVRSLVERSGYGATRLFELFRIRFGTTPAAFLTKAKVDLARKLLTESEMTIAEVAYAAGFQTPSVFHAHFKDITGLTASAYRARALRRH
ncbi:MAG TPA: Ada metal-binding domain-containing protein [Dehalococcoidia bacterium]|nr:Ada metal-binding domain-containing protein [Dehalococcoidia bacterium]